MTSHFRLVKWKFPDVSFGQPQVAYDKKKRSMVAPDVLDEVGQVFEELCPSLWGRSPKMKKLLMLVVFLPVEKRKKVSKLWDTFI